MTNLSDSCALERFATELVQSGSYSCVSLAMVGPGGTGRGYAGGAKANSLFDLASLSKPFLSTLVLWLCDRGRLALEESVFPKRLERSVSLEALLRHQGGAIAWWPLYRQRVGTALPTLDTGEPFASGLTAKREQHLTQLLASQRWGHSNAGYSDIGYITAARWIEQRLEQPLEKLFRACWEDLLPNAAADNELLLSGKEVARDPRVIPCGLETTKEVELAANLGRPVDLLGSALPGLPQDGNARYMTEVLHLHGGHAGLFGSLDALLEIGQLWLHWAMTDTSALSGTMDREADESQTSLVSLAHRALRPEGGRLLGWFRPDASFGPLSPDGFGHTGFVGGGLWIDPRRQVVAVMLGYRSDPRSNLTLQRSNFCALADPFGEEVAYPRSPLAW